MKLEVEILNDKLQYSWQTSSASTETCEMELTAEGLVMFAHLLELCCKHRNFESLQRERKLLSQITP